MQLSIQRLIAGQNLTPQESRHVMKEIMAGRATAAQIGAFLTALRMKGETVEEITAFATVMKKFCRSISPTVQGRLVDTCGTGGDAIKTFNISTTAAFVVAGAGVPVAKHGNRSVTSKSGSADVLERLGLNLTLTPAAVKKAIEEVGIGFLFAPAFHPAMKHAIGPRREIGIRTIFNILGPLTNPANANAQVIGLYSPRLVETLACVLKELGCTEAMVVHGLDGLDEISTIGETTIAWLKEGNVTTLAMTPRDLNLPSASPKDIRGASPDESARITFNILYEADRKHDPKGHIVMANAAAGIIVGGKADNFVEGVELATESLASGAAYKKLKALIRSTTGSRPSQLEELESAYA